MEGLPIYGMTSHIWEDVQYMGSLPRYCEYSHIAAAVGGNGGHGHGNDDDDDDADDADDEDDDDADHDNDAYNDGDEDANKNDDDEGDDGGDEPHNVRCEPHHSHLQFIERKTEATTMPNRVSMTTMETDCFFTRAAVWHGQNAMVCAHASWGKLLASRSADSLARAQRSRGFSETSPAHHRSCPSTLSRTFWLIASPRAAPSCLAHPRQHECQAI